MRGAKLKKKQKSSPCICGQDPSSRFVDTLLVAADMQRHAHNGKHDGVVGCSVHAKGTNSTGPFLNRQESLLRNAKLCCELTVFLYASRYPRIDHSRDLCGFMSSRELNVPTSWAAERGPGGGFLVLETLVPLTRFDRTPERLKRPSCLTETLFPDENSPCLLHHAPQTHPTFLCLLHTLDPSAIPTAYTERYLQKRCCISSLVCHFNKSCQYILSLGLPRKRKHPCILHCY
jgi:hypothetical protein